MASESNIVMSGFTQTNEIYSGSNPISQVYIGNSLIWEKTPVSGESWVNYTSDYLMMVKYTPSINMNVASFSMLYDKNSSVYNYVVGIFSSTGLKIIGQTGTVGVSIVSEGDLLTKTKYRHTKTYTGTGPALTAGQDYYMVLGELYSAYQAVSSTTDQSGAGYQAYGWSMVSTSTTPAPPTAIGETLYLKVVAQ